MFRVAFARWVDTTNHMMLTHLVRESLDELKTVTCDDPNAEAVSEGGLGGRAQRCFGWTSPAS